MKKIELGEEIRFLNNCSCVDDLHGKQHREIDVRRYAVYRRAREVLSVLYQAHKKNCVDLVYRVISPEDYAYVDIFLNEEGYETIEDYFSKNFGKD